MFAVVDSISVVSVDNHDVNDWSSGAVSESHREMKRQSLIHVLGGIELTGARWLQMNQPASGVA